MKQNKLFSNYQGAKMIFRIIPISLIAAIFFSSLITIFGQNKPIELKYGAQYTGKRTDEAMNKWRNNRFGQFIHWGLYAIPGGIWKGKTYNYASEFLKESANIPTPVWDSLQFQFNPIKFNAVSWAKMSKQMGVKYITITTKHHEGFCLWSSKFTDFDIENTPYKKDIIKQIIEAYNNEGIDVNLYYSVLDWHHPDWRYDLKTPEDKVAFDRYLEFAKNQLQELAVNYPTIKALWFDGTWDNSVKKNGKWTLEVEQMLKKVHPGIIVNSRLRADELGSRHKDSNGQLMGDFESGYERRLPNPTDDSVTKWDWEAVMTIPENQWGFHADWTVSHVKTSNELIEMLVRAVALGGNFMLNFGPKADGTFRIEEQKIATEIGNWMKINGETIYGCDYAGLERQDWGYFTKKTGTDKIYMVVFNVPVSGELKVNLPQNLKITKQYLLTKPFEQLRITDYEKNKKIINLKNRVATKPFVIVLETMAYLK